MGKRSPAAGPASDMLLSRSNPVPIPGLNGASPSSARPRGRRQASYLLDLGSDLGDNKAIPNAFTGAVPASFTTQMAYATGINRPASPDPNQNRLSKLVLARMNNIEEGFREIIKEVKDLRRGESSRSQSQPEDYSHRERKRRIEKKKGKKRSQGSRETRTSAESSWSDMSSD